MIKEHYPSINMLRGVAAMMVCFYHFMLFSDLNGQFLSPDLIGYTIGKLGLMGVYVFFIITGFVIPLSLFKNDFQLGQLHRFLFKRWVRIEIPYLISLGLILLVAMIISYRRDLGFLLDPIKILHHIFYTVLFFGYDWYNPIYWTLAIEMQFYILIALLFPAMNSKRPVLNLLAPLVLALSTLFIEDHRLVFYNGAIFSQGIYLLLILNNRVNLHLGIVGVILSAVITLIGHGTEIALTTILTVGVIAFLNVDKKIFNKLGEISYSLYLTHGLTGVYLVGRYYKFADDVLSKWALVLMAFAFSLIGAYLFSRFIEEPSKRWAKRISILSSKKIR